MSSNGVQDADERLRTLVHDIRTPLAIITGFCDLLERQKDRLSDEQREDYQQRIKAAAHDLVEILDRERDERLSREL